MNAQYLYLVKRTRRTQMIIKLPRIPSHHSCAHKYVLHASTLVFVIQQESLGSPNLSLHQADIELC